MRCQANTTELMADNAPLMRLREPEVLEKVATVLTDKDTIVRDVEEQIRRRAGELVLAVVSAGVRAVILRCGTKAKKAAAPRRARSSRGTSEQGGAVLPGGTGPRRPLRPTGSPTARKRPRCLARPIRQADGDDPDALGVREGEERDWPREFREEAQRARRARMDRRELYDCISRQLFVPRSRGYSGASAREKRELNRPAHLTTTSLPIRFGDPGPSRALRRMALPLFE